MPEINLTTKKGFRFKVIKESDDPLTNRLSIGGEKDKGCYIVFRGNIADCKEVLEQAVEAFKIAYSQHLKQGN